MYACMYLVFVCMYVYACVCTYDSKGFPIIVTFLFLPSSRQPFGIWALPEPSIGLVGEATNAEECRLAYRPEYITRHVKKRADQGVDVGVIEQSMDAASCMSVPIVLTQIIRQDPNPGLELFRH